MKIRRPFSVWDPETLAFRLIMLVGICFLTFGSYFVYDIPAALEGPLTDRLKMNGIEYGALYSVYSWPNTVLALIGGFLLDRVFGVRLGAIIFCSLCAAGMFVFALGVAVKSYWTALVGRFIFGLGGECLSVSQSTYTAKWFKGKELALAFGIGLSFSRVGSAVNLNVMPYLTKHWSLPIAIWIGVFVCLISFFFALFLAFMDWQGTKYQNEHGTTPANQSSEEKISLTDVKDFPLSMWLLVFICVAFYIGVFVFVQNGSTFFQTKWGFSLEKADSVLSIISTFSAVASPFLGFGVDKIGFNVTWVLVASAVLCGDHLLLALTKVTPIAGMVIMGAGYSVCAAALWPTVALVMPSHQLGTAYGLMTAMQNLGLAVAPLAIGAVFKASHSNYLLVELIFSGCAGVSALFAVLLIFVDISRGRKLNCSAKRLKELSELKDAEKESKEPLLTN